MRTPRLSRAKIGLAAVIALALTAKFLAQAIRNTNVAHAAEPVAPAFGRRPGRGRPQSLPVTASPREAENADWLRLADDDHLVAATGGTPHHE